MEQDNKLGIESQNKNLDSKADFSVFFKNDADFAFVYKKTEKLMTAVYMVTNFFSDNEPMKWTLRKNTSELLSFTLGYKDIFYSQQTNFLNTLKTKILEIVSLLEVASLSGLVSQMNFSVLKQEFSNLAISIDTSNVVNKDTFPKAFFDVARFKAQDDYSRHQLSESRVPHNESVQPIRDRSLIKDKHIEKRSNRQNTIISLLKKKGELTIKDMSQVIKDCSEKTIQRELNSFMSAGIIRRTGERRWSKYSLA